MRGHQQKTKIQNLPISWKSKVEDFRVFRGFEQLSSSIALRVMDLQIDPDFKKRKVAHAGHKAF